LAGTARYLKGKRRFKSDPFRTDLGCRYFVAERAAIEPLDNQLATLEQQLDGDAWRRTR